MGQASGMEPLYGASDLDAHMEMCEPSAFVFRLDKSIAQFGRGKPFALFLLAFESTPLKEELLLVGGHHHTEFALPLDQLGWPAEELLPIVATGLVEYAVAVDTGDVLQSVLGIGILRRAENPTT